MLVYKKEEGIIGDICGSLAWKILAMERYRRVICMRLKFIVFLSTMMFHVPSYTSKGNRMTQLTSSWRHHKEEFGTSEWLCPTTEQLQSWQNEDDDSGNLQDDLIKDGLPGQHSEVNFKQYAGYVNVNKSKGRNLFYYFVEASQSPSSKPLVLWLNGDPGASSLGLGAMLELGHFGVNPDGETLYERPYAWNKVANMLFLESPVGVGFSYSNTSSDYKTSNDKRTGSHITRLTRDFYITGESYAGYYIPELAEVIIKSNKETAPASNIQLKGIMIGNGLMSMETNQRGQYDYVWSHALISEKTHSGLIKYCFHKHSTKICQKIDMEAWKEMGDIDPYAIYSPLCRAKQIPPLEPPRQAGYDTSESKNVYAYLNLRHVQKALRVNTTKLSYHWNLVNFEVNQNWKDMPSTMFPTYKRLISSGLRILLYSGDTDSVVTLTSTQYAIAALNQTVIRPWHSWTDDTREVAGYKVIYNGVTFMTVRGAGHTVPQRSLALFNNFLTNF